MKTGYFHAIIVQSSAPLLLLALSVAISRLLGAAEQGAFVSAKSWLDVLVAAGCFGFPQSIIIAINRFGVSRRRLYVMACLYALAVFPFLVVATCLFSSTLAPGIVLTAMLSLGATCIVLINIWRGILLTVDDGLRFHAITALPSRAIVVTVAVGLILDFELVQIMPYVFFASGLLALSLGYVLCPWSLVRGLDGKSPDLSQLVTNGADVFVQALSSTLQVFICFAWLRHQSGLEATGYFSVALMIMNAFGFPLQSISPMILNHWSKQRVDLALNAGRQVAWKPALGLVVITVMGILLAPWLIPLALGRKFTQAVPAVQVMIACMLPMLLLRIGSLRLAATGNFRLNSMVAAGRCILLLVLLAILAAIVPRMQSATAVALCWLLAESAAAAVTLLNIRALRQTHAITEDL